LTPGEVVIAQFAGEGTNDGPFGSLKPTGRRMSLQFCEVEHIQPLAAAASNFAKPTHLASALRPVRFSYAKKMGADPWSDSFLQETVDLAH
jgi:hypothetical protein